MLHGQSIEWKIWMLRLEQVLLQGTDNHLLLWDLRPHGLTGILD